MLLCCRLLPANQLHFDGAEQPKAVWAGLRSAVCQHGLFVRSWSPGPGAWPVETARLCVQQVSGMTETGSGSLVSISTGQQAGAGVFDTKPAHSSAPRRADAWVRYTVSAN